MGIFLLIVSRLIGLLCNGQSNAQGDSITFPVEIASNLVYMVGEVNETGPFSVVLDTGSSVSVVTPAAAKLLSLKTEGSTKAAGLGEGSDQTIKFVQNADLGWGPAFASLRLRKQMIAVLPIDYVGRQTGHVTDAIFGANLYNAFSITVDYDRQLATFGPGNITQHKGTLIPLEILDNVPYITASLTGTDGKSVSARFLLDTGTRGALTLNRRFLEAHPEITVGRRFVRVPKVVAVGGSIEAQEIRIPSLTFGGYRISEPVAFVPDRPAGGLVSHDIAGIIGADFMRRFVITWDYRGKKLWLIPTKHLHDKFEVDASGLHLVADLNDLNSIHVDSVLTNSAAAASDIQPGDQIVAVNGKKGLALWKITQMLTHPGSLIRLSIIRNKNNFPRLIRLKRIV